MKQVVALALSAALLMASLPRPSHSPSRPVSFDTQALSPTATAYLKPLLPYGVPFIFAMLGCFQGSEGHSFYAMAGAMAGLRTLLKPTSWNQADEDKELEAFIRERTAAYHFAFQRWKKPKIVAFGTARAKETDAIYRVGMRVGHRMAELGYRCMTGAGMGNMESVPRGGKVKMNYGVKIFLVKEKKINKYLSKLFICHFFPTRKWALYSGYVAGGIVLHGGIGSFDEKLEIWRRGIWFVMVGKMWKPILATLEDRWKAAGLWDRIRFHPEVVDEEVAEAAVDRLDAANKDAHKKYLQNPELYVNEKQVDKANHELRKAHKTISDWEPAVILVGRPNPAFSEAELRVAAEVSRRLTEQQIAVRIGSRGSLFSVLSHSLYHVKRTSLVSALLFISAYKKDLPNHLTPDEMSIANLLAFQDVTNHQYLLTKKALGYVFVPGSLETMNTLFNLICNMQCEKIPQKPIILVGRQFWQPIFDVMFDEMLKQQPSLVSPKDRDLVSFVDSTEEVMTALDPIQNAAIHMREHLAAGRIKDAARRGIKAWLSFRKFLPDWEDVEGIRESLALYMKYFVRTMIRLGNPAYALKMLSGSAAIASFGETPEYWRSVGKVFLRLGQHGQGIQDLEAAARRFEQNFLMKYDHFVETLGRLYLQAASVSLLDRSHRQAARLLQQATDITMRLLNSHPVRESLASYRMYLNRNERARLLSTPFKRISLECLLRLEKTLWRANSDPIPKHGTHWYLPSGVSMHDIAAVIERARHNAIPMVDINPLWPPDLWVHYDYVTDRNTDKPLLIRWILKKGADGEILNVYPRGGEGLEVFRNGSPFQDDRVEMIPVNHAYWNKHLSEPIYVLWGKNAVSWRQRSGMLGVIRNDVVFGTMPLVERERFMWYALREARPLRQEGGVEVLHLDLTSTKPGRAWTNRLITTAVLIEIDVRTREFLRILPAPNGHPQPPHAKRLAQAV